MVAKKKHPGGRPCSYTKELAKKICDAVASSTIGLRRLCQENEDFPSHETVYQWRNKFPDFSDQYANAKRKQAELLAEEILDIADDNSQDATITAEGIKFNNDFYQRSRLKIDTRKWIACKLLPKIYGDKTPENASTNDAYNDLVKRLKTDLNNTKSNDKSY